MECEGFICPYCLVGFSTSGKLQSHFVDMHANQGQAEDYDEVEYVEEETNFQASPKSSNASSPSSSSPLGHQFQVVRQTRPKACDACNDIIWQDGLVCQACQVTVHVDTCLDKLTARCSSDSVFETEASPADQDRRPSSTPKGILPLVRRQVAKGRDRYVNDEFDLDLTYITERIIAMSFPATGMESAYRNNLKDVAKMLKTKHEENYMIFNLSERSYDISRFNNQVLDFGWPDHLAPSLERLSSVCKSIKSWLDSEPLHVAVVHCKGGKGRTGCVIAAFMHYTEICHSAAAALDRFAMKRFYDNKMGGVTQPSQKKYVHYFSDLLAGKIDLYAPPVVLQYILLHGIPNFDSKGGCRVFLKIYLNMKLVHTSGLFICSADEERIKIPIYGGLQLQGEVLVKCFHKRVHTGMDSIFRCQFPSAVVKDDLRLVYSKADLDDAFKDKRFGENIKVELLFGEGEENEADAKEIADVRTSLLDSKQPQMNGSTELSHDHMASRDSYVGFPGGYDSGVPGEDTPDLMGHVTPDMKPKRERDRTESSSFQMDPSDIERVTHKSQVYTVVSRPFKQGERDPKVKPYKSSADIPPAAQQRPPPKKKEPGLSYFPPARPPPPHLLRKQASADCIMSDVHFGVSHLRGGGGGIPPPTLPPPRPPSEPSGLRTDDDYADYTEVDDTSPISSTDNSPFHRPAGVPPMQIKQQAGHAKKSSLDSDKILLDVQAQSHALPTHSSQAKAIEHGSAKPIPPTKPTEHAQKPALASKPSDIAREHKKQELHQKYSKIREELIRKQGHSDAPVSKGAANISGSSQAAGAGPVAKDRPAQRKKPEYKENVKAHVRPKPPKGHKLRSRPSYAEVEPNFEITVEPVPNRVSQTDSDNTMWMRVKYPTMPKKGESMGKRSSSSSNITSNSDYYSNLAELQLDPSSGGAGALEGSGTDSMGRRRHSFSEGEERMIIRASTGSRDSVIDINSRAMSDNRLDQVGVAGPANTGGDPDYKNLQYREDGSLEMDPEVDPATSSFNDQIKILGNITGGGPQPRNYENTRPVKPKRPATAEVTDEDYMNDDAEGLDHVYSNHDELLMQMQAENQPLPEEIEKALPLDSSQRQRLGSGAAILKFLKNNILKSRQHTEIHSSNIGEGAKNKTLAPFAISGIEVGRVNRDYEAFFKTSAWGNESDGQGQGGVNEASGGESVTPPVSSVSVPQSEPVAEQPPKRERHTKQERPSKPSLPVPLSKPRSKTSGDITGEQKEEGAGKGAGHSPMVPRSHGANVPGQKRPPIMPPPPSPAGQGQAQSKQPHERLPPVPHFRSVQQPARPSSSGPAGNLSTSPPSGSVMPPRPHARLQASNSDATVLPKARSRDADRPLTTHDASSSMPRHKRGGHHHPPVPPPPYQQHQLQHQPIEAQVTSQMQYWYQPKITREEAIELVRPKTSGSFIVRDSSTVKGGYALTLKITPAIVRSRKKLGPEDKVTEDMLVTHFLIQPDPIGVKLQGWSEKPFRSLPLFIYGHVNDKLCLPCKLKLPGPPGAGEQGDIPAQSSRRQAAGPVKAMHSGAACDLIYLGSVDVSSAGSDSLLTQTVQQLQSLDLSTFNIVTITVSREGITLQEANNGSRLKRQYPFSLITYCGLDPVSRWSFPNLHLDGTGPLTDKICFGVVHRPLNSFGYSCMVFAEYNSAQPVTSVVNFIQKMLREHRHSSKYNMKN